jgi:hypothetical protein
MAAKNKASIVPVPGTPELQRALKKLAQVEGSRMTGVPVKQIQAGKPIAGKNTSKKKGTK